MTVEKILEVFPSAKAVTVVTSCPPFKKQLQKQHFRGRPFVTAPIPSIGPVTMPALESCDRYSTCKNNNLCDLSQRHRLFRKYMGCFVENLIHEARKRGVAIIPDNFSEKLKEDAPGWEYGDGYPLIEALRARQREVVRYIRADHGWRIRRMYRERKAVKKVYTSES